MHKHLVAGGMLLLQQQRLL